MEFEDWGATVEVKSVTETTQYATITYERDKLMPHYDELVALEEEYCRIEDNLRNANEQKIQNSHGGYMPLIVKIGFVASGILFTVFASSTLAVIASPLLLAGCLYYGIKEKKKSAAEAKARYAEAERDIATGQLEQQDAESRLNRLSRMILQEMRAKA